MKKNNKVKSLKQALKDFHVTIFGSARIKEGDPEYKEIYKLARMIGKNGINLVTGGGPGVMRAANTGHIAGREESDPPYAIGLGIKLPHEQRVDPYLDIKVKFTRFSERLDNFMLLSNAIIVAPGGIGTMLELFFSWQLMQVKHTCSIPIILLGKQWHGLLKWLKEVPLKRKFFNREDLELLFYAENSKQAMEIVSDAYKHFKEDKKDFCLNYKKYKKHLEGK